MEEIKSTMESEINNYLLELIINPIIRDEIFQYLKFQEIFRLRRVCRSIKMFVDETYLPELKQLNAYEGFRWISAEGIKILSEHTCSLQFLKVGVCQPTDHFNQLISNPNLIGLNLSIHFLVSWDFIISIFDLKNLAVLIVNYSDCPNFRRPPVLSHLKMADLERALSTCSIQALHLSSCNWVTDSFLKVLSNSQILTNLELLRAEITDVGLSYLANGFPNLKTLYISLELYDDITNTTEQYFKILSDRFGISFYYPPWDEWDDGQFDEDESQEGYQSPSYLSD